MSTVVAPHIDEIQAALERRRANSSLAEEAAELSGDLRLFLRRAWHVLEPETPFVDNWHIGAICEQLEDVSAGRLRRLTVWVPPGSTKTRTVSIMWPAWEWTRQPWLRYLYASYDFDMAVEQGTQPSRLLLESPWFQERFGGGFRLREDFNKKDAFANDQGGARYTTAPNARKATGRHVHRILIDDPSEPKSLEAVSERALEDVIRWHDAVLPTRFASPRDGVEIIVMQRLHVRDLAGHVIERDGPEAWRVLCLPERYDPKHPFLWPDDPRREGELLCPARVDADAHERRKRELTGHRWAGQLQQMPAAREGEILKRYWWRFYDPRWREVVLADPKRLPETGFPRFRMVVLSVDTPLKDKETSDYVAVQCYGVSGGDRYLLDLAKGLMNFGKAKRAVREMALWARQVWPRVPHFVLVENAGYGPELADDLKSELTGVRKIDAARDGDKEVRAESASDALESGNCYIPGAGPPWRGPAYDEAGTPAEIIDFVDSLATFPRGAHDDDVDAWSQCMNWLRSRGARPARTSSLRRVLARR